MDWTKPGRLDTFRYVRVSWPGFAETEDISASVRSCIYTHNRLADLAMSGSLDMVGALDIGDDMVRCYSTSTLGGETVETCHFTMLAGADTTTFSAATGTTSVDLYGVLKVLQDELTDETLTIAAGTEPVGKAAAICKARSLPVSAAPHAGTLTGALVFDPGTSYLSVVNSLLGAAGYAAASQDAYGNVVMAPYEDASGKAASCKVSEAGGDLLCSPDVTRGRSWSDVCNVVTLTGSDADGNPLRAQARNDDAASKWSTKTRGRVVSRYEEVSDATTQAALETKAANYLREETMKVETVELQHFWRPFSVGDAIEVDLPGYGVQATYSTTSRKVSMTPGMRCTTSARRYVDLEGLQ